MSLSGFEKKRFILSMVFPVFFLLVIWLIKLTEIVFETSFAEFGVYPKALRGIPGIFLSPLIHKDFNHLIANSVPVLTLSGGLFYFYNKISYKVFFLLYFITGMWVWFGAREAYHIGASGLVYGLASFLFFSGIIRNDIRLMSISMLVVFLYGSMIWGIFPLQEEISWESHLSGSVAGLLLAIYYRKQGPQKIRHEWEINEDEPDDPDTTYKNIDYTYTFIGDNNDSSVQEETKKSEKENE